MIKAELYNLSEAGGGATFDKDHIICARLIVLWKPYHLMTFGSRVQLSPHYNLVLSSKGRLCQSNRGYATCLQNVGSNPARTTKGFDNFKLYWKNYHFIIQGFKELIKYVQWCVYCDLGSIPIFVSEMDTSKEAKVIEF